MRIEPKNLKSLLSAAMGKTNCDLAIKNVNYVNVFTEEVYPATVFIKDGFVVYVEDENLEHGIEKADTVVDATDKYLIPGFIDAHVHIESSLMTPENFAKAVLPWGTTTIVSDPHEIGNVFGEEAVVYMHDAGKSLPMRQLIHIPSCVPSVPGLEVAGADFEADAIERLAQLENVVGLAEVMDFLAVINGEDRMMDILKVARANNLFIQGHITVEDKRMINAYALGGPKSCHETRTAHATKAKLRAGMYVDARDSSFAKNIGEIYEGFKNMPNPQNVTVCTDDREADDILNAGHMNLVTKLLIEEGMDSVKAIKSASLNVALQVNLENIGAVAPGYVADMLIVDNLNDLNVEQVYYSGQLVAKDGQMVVNIPEQTFQLESKNSMELAPTLSIEDFVLKAPCADAKQVSVNVLSYLTADSSLTTLKTMDLPVTDGKVDISQNEDLCFAMIINRYGTGKTMLGVVENFGLKVGADASTVSHDSHNLTIVFKDAQSAFTAYKTLCQCKGGIVCTIGEDVKGLLPLEVAGLMTKKSPEETAKMAIEVKEKLREMGIDIANPLLRIATLALPVVPEYKFTDLGLVDVLSKKFIPIFN